MEQLLQQHLIRVQQRQKHQADKNRTERTYTVGQSVFVKLQPYIQTSLAHRRNQKLSFRYFGPYKIIQKIGNVAYKLELPATSSVHPVFHVSQLKVAVTAPDQVSAEIPETPAAFQYPLKILQRRRHRHNHSVIDQILVQWSMWPAHLATWEDEQALKLIFPSAPAWGQAGSQEGRNVTMKPTSEPEPEGGVDDDKAKDRHETNKDAMQSERPKRKVRPNSKYLGPSWTKP
jgi:ribosomal protein L21E